MESNSTDRRGATIAVINQIIRAISEISGLLRLPNVSVFSTSNHPRSFAMKITLRTALAMFALLFFSRHSLAAEPSKADAAKHEIVYLWPGTAPGEKGDIGEEKDTSPG